MIAGAGVVGVAFSGMLADWIFPFIYNVGLIGAGEAMLSWLLLGGLVLLRR